VAKAGSVGAALVLLALRRLPDTIVAAIRLGMELLRLLKAIATRDL
jgi:Flp pilus assembly CpaF family ATPase